MPILTGDFGDLIAGAAVNATVTAYVETNVEANHGLVDTTNNMIRLGKRYPLSTTDGAFTVDLPSTDATDLGLPAGQLQYQVVATFTDPGSKGKDVWQSGWFFHTAAGDLSDKATSPTTSAPAATTDSTVSPLVAAGSTSTTMANLKETFVGRDVATKHAPALGLYFPEAAGAVRDGVTDDTAALQSAADAAALTGGTVALRGGSYYTATGFTLAFAARLAGAGRGATSILAPDATVAVTITGNRCAVEDVRFSCTAATPTAGAAIKLMDNPSRATLRGLHISGFYDLVDHESGNGTTFDGIYFVDTRRYGLRIRNITNPDAGDHNLDNLLFDSSHPGTTAIRIESSGGSKLSNVKILNHEFGIDLAVADIATSILTVTGCSIESQDTACIRLGRSGTTGTYSEITITGCQLNGGTTAAAIINNAGCSQVTIVGNTLKGDAANTAILLNASEKQVVSGNSFITWGKGVVIAAGVARYTIGDNEYGDVPTPVEELTARSQPAPGRVVRQHRRLLSTSSDTTYTNLWKIDLDNYRAGRVDLVIEGLANGAADFARTVSKMLSRATGDVTVTAVTDVAAGTAIDVQFDVTTTPGSVLVGLKRATGVGTSLSGSVSLSASGGIRAITSV